MVEALRTPEDRFHDVAGWDYSPSYVEDLPGYEGLRAHYIDLGPRDARDTYLLLHGEPTWAYLYRKMIPVFVEAGGRVVAPDFFGFGRSDKPVEQGVYSFDFHREYLLRLVERLDLTGITLVVQDRGGLLGLTLPVDAGFAARLFRLLAMNTALAVGISPGKDFENWRAYVAAHPDLAVGELLKRSVPTLSDAEAAAYDAPFPDASYKAGARAFPQLVMTDPDMPGVEISRAAQQFWSQWDVRASSQSAPRTRCSACRRWTACARPSAAPRHRWSSPTQVTSCRNTATSSLVPVSPPSTSQLVIDGHCHSPPTAPSYARRQRSCLVAGLQAIPGREGCRACLGRAGVFEGW